MVIPLLNMVFCSLVAISSAAGVDNFFSVLINMSHPENPERKLFKTLIFQEACNECMKAGKGSSCQHNAGFIPYWRVREAHNKHIIEAMYMGNKDLMNQELGGAMTNKREPAFETRLVGTLMTAPIVKLDGKKVSVVWTFVDPNQFGEPSDTALLTVTSVGGKIVLLASDIVNTFSVVSAADSFKAHMRHIRSLPQLAKALIIFVPEENSQQASAQFMNDARMDPHIGNIICFTEHQKTGVLTTNARKERYMNLTICALNNDLIRFWDKFSCIVTPGRVGGFLDNIYEQMTYFKRTVQQKGDGRMPVITYSGKVAQKKDDWVDAFIMMCYWMRNSMQGDVPMEPYNINAMLSAITSLRDVRLVNKTAETVLDQVKEAGGNTSPDFDYKESIEYIRKKRAGTEIEHA